MFKPIILFKKQQAKKSFTSSSFWSESCIPESMQLVVGKFVIYFQIYSYTCIYIYINIPHCTRKLIKTDQFNEISANIQSLDVSCKHAIEIVCLYTIILWSFKGKPVNRFIVFVRILSSVRFNSLIFNLPVLREKKRMFLYHGRSTGV